MSRKLTGLLILVNLIVFNACSQAQPSGEYDISVADVREKIAAGDSIVLLDVRTEAEYDGSLGHVDSSFLIPLSDLAKKMDELEKYKEQEIIVICRSGNRSGYATKLLRDKGFKAFNMTGGMIAWNDFTPTETKK
jgi:adenylyltransferase/sulfurtransferase